VNTERALCIPFDEGQYYQEVQDGYLCVLTKACGIVGYVCVPEESKYFSVDVSNSDQSFVPNGIEVTHSKSYIPNTPEFSTGWWFGVGTMSDSDSTANQRLEHLRLLIIAMKKETEE
jgi:hypothetical protein